MPARDTCYNKLCEFYFYSLHFLPSLGEDEKISTFFNWFSNKSNEINEIFSPNDFFGPRISSAFCDILDWKVRNSAVNSPEEKECLGNLFSFFQYWDKRKISLPHDTFWKYVVAESSKYNAKISIGMKFTETMLLAFSDVWESDEKKLAQTA